MSKVQKIVQRYLQLTDKENSSLFSMFPEYKIFMALGATLRYFDDENTTRTDLPYKDSPESDNIEVKRRKFKKFLKSY